MIRPCQFAAVITLLCVVAFAQAGGAYKLRAPDGTVMFTDVKPGAGNTRQYKKLANTDRGTATASCKGMNKAKLAARADKIDQSIKHFAKVYSVNQHLIKAIARIESCFDITAVSKAGAKGVMQLMPATANEFGITELFDYKQNIEAGVRYFSALNKQFEHNHRLALAAYNAGPGAVAHYGGVPPYRETQNYVVKVLRKYKEYSLIATR